MTGPVFFIGGIMDGKKIYMGDIPPNYEVHAPVDPSDAFISSGVIDFSVEALIHRYERLIYSDTDGKKFYVMALMSSKNNILEILLNSYVDQKRKEEDG
jgi:hypothetical protein